MFKITTKREMALLAATIDDQRRQIEELRKLVEHERKRSEGAINLLLMKTQRAALTPDQPLTLEDEEQAKERMLNLFGEGEVDEEKALEELQR